jgi:hypothetical protein
MTKRKTTGTLVWAKCVSCPWALQRNKVSTIWDYVSFFFLSPFFFFFFPFSGLQTFLTEGVVLGL